MTKDSPTCSWIPFSSVIAWERLRFLARWSAAAVCLAICAGCASKPHLKGEWHGTLVEVAVEDWDGDDILILGLQVEEGPAWIAGPPMAWRDSAPVVLIVHGRRLSTVVPADEFPAIGERRRVSGMMIEEKWLPLPRRNEAGAKDRGQPPVVEYLRRHGAGDVGPVLYIRPRDLERLQRAAR